MNIDTASGRPRGGWKGRGRDAERRKPGGWTDRQEYGEHRAEAKALVKM